MPEHRKISRLLHFIVRLRSPFGCEKQEMADQFSVSIRTIERHILLLRDIGFHISQEGSRFYIRNAGKHKLLPEELIAFSLEEATIIRNALLNNPAQGAIQHLLLDKLYALTDLDELAETMSNLNQSLVITRIRLALQNKEQVLLKGYESANSNSKGDRLVEPVRFQKYYRYLSAFEPLTAKMKVFKTDRIQDVVLTGKKWEFESQHLRSRLDVFGLTGDQPFYVELLLSQRARQLLCEEYPDAVTCLTIKGKKNHFCGEVYALEGVGRFVLGLLDEIKVIEPQALKEYLKEKIKKTELRHWLS
ncbi:MAG: hypothetical protein CVT92_05590 [Bacteroidetes bacterium HGW-Bacteroidetes-1]|jgi:predicted DNA-binding transcriptional regulator YafY|nr:MAG: hypothetical protein CVT92_05590 [Bacteroidetes bacterium HGW-Bacteroidetes-1]